MKAGNVSAIVFANTSDERMGDLTAVRSSASLPFGARYRLIDFALSNLVNAGISNVGVITKENYRSLMDHIGSGIYWDLDRKNGGLHILPPFNIRNAIKYSGYVDALNGAKNYILRSKSDYIVICDANVVANIELEAALEAHIENSADITLLWHKGNVPSNYSDTMVLKLDKEQRINELSFCEDGSAEQNHEFGFYIINTDVLINMIDLAYQNGLSDLKLAFFVDKVKKFRIFGFEHKGYLSVIDNEKSYYNANMDLLKADTRAFLFNKERPILTKTRDDMPTRYGTHAVVSNCAIGDGCIIDGTVKNSILFRGVKVEKGAVVENSIIMQSGVISKGANLNFAILDKNVTVGEDKVLCGTVDSALMIGKGKKL
ncbi:MAG: glucose-1-phosphate adenylyltransferase subunit GlgD [Ruminococcaceae bacterium]|nr:glucose-1-phosphate adenylyltransferase subunit GlgD [Oscillospiraceae bacterium]